MCQADIICRKAHLAPETGKEYARAHEDDRIIVFQRVTEHTVVFGLAAVWRSVCLKQHIFANRAEDGGLFQWNDVSYLLEKRIFCCPGGW